MKGWFRIGFGVVNGCPPLVGRRSLAGWLKWPVAVVAVVIRGWCPRGPRLFVRALMPRKDAVIQA